MILITGGGGFIGLNLAYDLADRGQNVLLVRRHAFNLPSFLEPFKGSQVLTAQGDIADPVVLKRLILDYGVESIIHAAVLNESGNGNTLHQAIKANVQGTADILEAARSSSLRRVTFLSSISVYMPFSGKYKILREDHDLPAISQDWISGTKKAGEQICFLYAREYGLSVPVVRPPQVWGPLYWTHRSPIQTMFESAITGKAADLNNYYGGSTSPYIYVRDCARAISLIHLAPSLKHDIYNFSDKEVRSLADFSSAIKEEIPGAQLNLRTVQKEGDMLLPPMDNTRIHEDLGFIPGYSLKKAVRAYIGWIKEGKYL
jgi:UDP-glucose 4-epimerase